jgi:hypothetical protein
MWDGQAYYVDVRSNSTLLEANFTQSQKSIALSVAGLSGTAGFCNITIPRPLLEGDPWTVLVNDSPPSPAPLITYNATHTCIYVTYTHSTTVLQLKGTHVIFELSLLGGILVLVLLTTTIAVTNRRRRNTQLAGRHLHHS